MANVINLIENQMALWNLKRRILDLGQRPGRCLENGVAYGPCLLISRQRGSGGRRLAELAGERLGWHVFDRQILDDITKLANVRARVMGSIDQNVREKWDNGWKSEVQPEDIGYESYLRYLRQVVLALGHQGDIVMLGRGAQYLLPSLCALRVRVVAPFELRVNRICRGGGLSETQAREQIQTADTERRAFALNCFKREPDDPLNYDLVLNSAETTVEGSTEIVLQALRQKLGIHAAELNYA